MGKRGEGKRGREKIADEQIVAEMMASSGACTVAERSVQLATRSAAASNGTRKLSRLVRFGAGSPSPTAAEAMAVVERSGTGKREREGGRRREGLSHQLGLKGVRGASPKSRGDLLRGVRRPGQMHHIAGLWSQPPAGVVTSCGAGQCCMWLRLRTP